MDERQIHRARSPDGTEVAGHVSGQGPPIVFVHGALADGRLDWGEVAPILDDRFTCHLMSTRGRPPSGQSRDLSPARCVEDVVAYADSLGAPVCLAGLSGGGPLVLGAAARARSIAAVAAYEPAVLEAMDEETAAGFRATVARMEEAAAHGRMSEAARIFLDGVGNEAEMAALGDAGALETAGRFVPVQLEEFRQTFASDEPPPADPAALAAIAAPVLLLHGSATPVDWFGAAIRRVSKHVADCRVREIAGAGHLGPATAPEAVAEALAAFFGQAAARRAAAGPA